MSRRFPVALAWIAWAFATLAVGETATANPPAVHEADTAADPLPAGAVARLGSCRLQQGASVYSVAFSPDGRQVLSAGTNGVIRFWNVRTGREEGTIAGNARNLSTRFLANGQEVVSGGDDIRFWERLTGRETRRISADEEPVRSIDFSPDEAVIAGLGNDVRIWEVNSGKLLRRFGAGAYTARLSPTGKTLATASLTGPIQVWEVATGKQLLSMEGDGDRIRDLRYSPNGQYLASGGETHVWLWDAATGKKVQQFLGHEKLVLALAFAPNGKTLATGSEDETIRLWDVASGKELQTIKGHVNAVLALAFSPDGKILASGGFDHAVHLWDVATGAAVLPQQGHQAPVSSVVFSPDGTRLYSASEDRTVRSWDVGTGKEVGEFTGHQGAVHHLAVPADGSKLASLTGSGSDRFTTIWNTETRHLLSQPRLANACILSLAFSPDSKQLDVAVGQPHLDRLERCRLFLLDATTGKENRTCAGPASDVRKVIFSPDGKRLVSVGILDSTIRVWDIAKETEVCRMRARAEAANSVAISPDGTTVALGSDDGTIDLWDATSGKEKGKLAGHRHSACTQLVFSPEGKHLASAGSDSTIRLWDVAAGKECVRWVGHQGSVEAVAFSPDGKRLASSSADATILVWNVEVVFQKESIPATSEAPERLQELWRRLLHPDGVLNQPAMKKMVHAPRQTVLFLQDRMKDLLDQEAHKEIAACIDRLDAPQFEERQQAMKALTELGPKAEVVLRGKLRTQPSLEVHTRIDQLLDGLKEAASKRSAEIERSLRAVEVLERIDSPESRGLLKKLADAGLSLPVAEEATESLKRLGKRTPQ
jgi:WD40 repeat protein